MSDTPADPYRVDPAKHRGLEVGILALWFRLRRYRAEGDFHGPARIEPRPRRRRS
jgi:hypothetical protein